MRLHSLVRRRPSPAMIVSSVALFVSLGGAGYAAVTIPNNSVGSNQLKNNAVTFRKINPGSVGTVRANLGQLQARVNGTCGAGSAVGAVDQAGKVTCNSALPGEFGTTANTATVTGTATTIDNINLASGSTFLAFANPTATVTGGGTTNQRVVVSCTLTVGSNTATRTVSVQTGTTTSGHVVSIPLQEAGGGGASSLSCTASADTGTLPTVSVQSQINALQTASNS